MAALKITPPLNVVTVFLFFILMVFSVSTLKRNAVWRDDLTLWKKGVFLTPLKARAHTNLGLSFAFIGDDGAALEEYYKAIELQPLNLFPYGPIAVIYGKRGNLDEAIKIFEYLKTELPRDYKAHTGLGAAYMLKGMVREAEQEFKEALKIEPGYEVARENLKRLEKTDR